jgi:hypothetical protein
MFSQVGSEYVRLFQVKSGNDGLSQGNSVYDMSGQVRSDYVWLVQVSSGSVRSG